MKLNVEIGKALLEVFEIKRHGGSRKLPSGIDIAGSEMR